MCPHSAEVCALIALTACSVGASDKNSSAGSGGYGALLGGQAGSVSHTSSPKGGSTAGGETTIPSLGGVAPVGGRSDGVNSSGGAGVGGRGSGKGGSSGGATASGSDSSRHGIAVGVNTWYLAPSWGFGSPWANGTDFTWANEFLSDLAPFKSLRLMDWNATNYSRVSHWSERRAASDPGNREIYIDSSTSGAYPGLAYELQFELCNRSQKVCWITLPMLADDDYFAKFAELARTMLDASRLLIVELSNEPDGFWFRQSDDAAAQGATLGLPGAAPYYQAAAFTTYRTLQMATIVRAALGSRVIVARCAVGNTDLLRSSLASVYTSSKWNPRNEVFDLLCMSAYFGSGRDGASYTIEQAKADIDELVNGGDGFEQLDAMRRQFGIPLFGVYEGGVHVLKNAGTFSRSAAAGPALSYLLDRAASYFDYFNFYTDASTWPDTEGSGAWGLKPQIGGAETGKSTAVKAWIQTHATD